ncbi:MAG: hypothetical protein ABSD29_26365 [Verrucomicrobiota bacterium]|jgi:p-aminobenzoyl-glutamate transporter AbgT
MTQKLRTWILFLLGLLSSVSLLVFSLIFLSSARPFWRTILPMLLVFFALSTFTFGKVFKKVMQESLRKRLDEQKQAKNSN